MNCSVVFLTKTVIFIDEVQKYKNMEAFVFANCNVEKKGKITYLPVYMASFMETNNSRDYIVERIQF